MQVVLVSVELDSLLMYLQMSFTNDIAVDESYEEIPLSEFTHGAALQKQITCFSAPPWCPTAVASKFIFGKAAEL